MKRIWERLEQFIEAKPFKDRIIYLLVAIVSICFMIDAILGEPARQAVAAANQQITASLSKQANLSVQVIELSEQIRVNPNDDLRKRIARIKHQVALIEDEIGEQLGQFVSPDQMNEALRSLVTSVSGVSIHSLKSEETVPLVTVDDIGEDQPNLYRRGVILELKGDFHGFVRYTDMLEDLPWVIGWQWVRVVNQDGKTPVFILRLHTLTLDRGWLRV